MVSKWFGVGVGGRVGGGMEFISFAVVLILLVFKLFYKYVFMDVGLLA